MIPSIETTTTTTTTIPTTTQKYRSAAAPSLLWLIGKRNWIDLFSRLLHPEDEPQLRDANQAASLLIFAIEYNAPSEIIRRLLDSNTDIMLMDACAKSQMPFRVAANKVGKTHTLIYLEAARQEANFRLYCPFPENTVKNLSSSSSSSSSSPRSITESLVETSCYFPGLKGDGGFKPQFISRPFTKGT